MGLTVLQIYDVSTQEYPLDEIAQRLRDKQELFEVYLIGLADQHLTAAIEIATIVNASQPRQHTRPKEFVVSGSWDAQTHTTLTETLNTLEHLQCKIEQVGMA